MSAALAEAKRSRRRCRLCGVLKRGKTPWGDPCVTFPGHVLRKPDPCIYSQFLLMQLGRPVTWDNPDVAILLGAVEQNTYGLTAATEYTLRITVHNSSRDKPALGTLVHVRWIEFGAGGQTRHGIATLSADVPVWPNTATVQTTWRTPATPGHYCIEVELQHTNDGNPANNLGWNNTQVHAAHSEVRRAIPIFNFYPNGCPPVREGGGPVLRPHRVFLGWAVLGAIAGGLVAGLRHGAEAGEGVPRLLIGAVEGYLLLAALGLLAEGAYAWIKRQRRRASREPSRHEPERNCNLVQIDVDSYVFEDAVGKEFEPRAAFAERPAVWQGRVEPAQFIFQPGEARRDVTLIVEAPDVPGPPANFNVNVRQGGAPVGGVTVTVTRGGA